MPSNIRAVADPTNYTPQKALEAIGNNLQKQYERWQHRVGSLIYKCIVSCQALLFNLFCGGTMFKVVAMTHDAPFSVLLSKQAEEIIKKLHPHDPTALLCNVSHAPYIF